MSNFVQLPSDPLYRSFFLRTLSHAWSSGADSVECFRALHDASPLTPANWLAAWTKMGSRLDKHAASMLRATPSQSFSAKMAFLRASNYHRTAFAPCFGHPFDKAVVMPAYAAMRSSFAEAAKLFDPPFTSLRIPFEKATLRGFLCSPSSTMPSNGRLMVVISGYDAPMEEV